MVINLSINRLVTQLKKENFNVIDDEPWIKIVKEETYTHTVVAQINKYVPTWFSIQDSVGYLTSEDRHKLLPIIFNYILRGLASEDMENHQAEEYHKREELISELVETKGYQQQGIMNQLADLDRELEISKVYMDGVITRMVDLLALLQAFGYQKSTLDGTKITIIDKYPVAQVDTDKQFDLKTLDHFNHLTYDEQLKIKQLVASYGATPIHLRKIPFSFYERATIATLPKQYKWIRRVNTNNGVKLYVFSDLNEGSAYEEVICDPKMFRVVTLHNPYPTYIGGSLK